ncbi:MAG: cytochrome C oxidase Cbb3, partial [Halothiobacillus sp. 13-55-253]
MNASSATMPSGASYDYDIVKMFTIASIVWAIVGMAAGLYIEITFGRLRPVHTNTVIWGFGGNALIATSFYVVQRTCQTRLWGGKFLLNTMFWAWQAVVLIGAWALVAGHSQGREYAEYPLVDNILMMIGLVIYAVVYANTLRRRSQPHIYVANWFYM